MGYNNIKSSGATIKDWVQGKTPYQQWLKYEQKNRDVFIEVLNKRILINNNGIGVSPYDMCTDKPVLFILNGCQYSNQDELINAFIFALDNIHVIHKNQNDITSSFQDIDNHTCQHVLYNTYNLSSEHNKIIYDNFKNKFDKIIVINIMTPYTRIINNMPINLRKDSNTINNVEQCIASFNIPIINRDCDDYYFCINNDDAYYIHTTDERNLRKYTYEMNRWQHVDSTINNCLLTNVSQYKSIAQYLYLANMLRHNREGNNEPNINILHDIDNLYNDDMCRILPLKDKILAYLRYTKDREAILCSSTDIEQSIIIHFEKNLDLFFKTLELAKASNLEITAFYSIPELQWGDDNYALLDKYYIDKKSFIIHITDQDMVKKEVINELNKIFNMLLDKTKQEVEKRRNEYGTSN